MRYATYNREKRTVTWHDETGQEMVRYFKVTEVDPIVTTGGDRRVGLETEYTEEEDPRIILPGTILITGVDY